MSGQACGGEQHAARAPGLRFTSISHTFMFWSTMKSKPNVLSAQNLGMSLCRKTRAHNAVNVLHVETRPTTGNADIAEQHMQHSHARS